MGAKYDKNKYVGKAVQLYPGDTYKKTAIIKDVDDLGFTFSITYSRCLSYSVGNDYFISHSKELSFRFL